MLGVIARKVIDKKRSCSSRLPLDTFSQLSSHPGDPFLCGGGLANAANAERILTYFKMMLEDLKDQPDIVCNVHDGLPQYSPSSLLTRRVCSI